MTGIFKENSSTLMMVLGLILGMMIFSFVTTANKGGDLGSFGVTMMSGVFQGMLLFLVAAGMSIVFGLMDILNLAQGAYFMLGAYIAYEIHHADTFSGMNPDVRFVFALVSATMIGTVLGVVLERFFIRPLYERPIFQIVLTFGVAILFSEGIKSVWGTQAYAWLDEFSIRESTFRVFDQQFSSYRLFVIFIGLLLIFGIALLLRRTRIGIIIRAGVEDSEMVEALGVNVRLVFTGVFALGCAVAAFGGAVAAPFLGANLGMGNAFLLGSIAVIVLGGLGSYEGTAIGSILVGLAIAVVAQFSVQYLSQTVWSSMTPMILLIVVLLLRPNGLFGRERSHA